MRNLRLFSHPVALKSHLKTGSATCRDTRSRVGLLGDHVTPYPGKTLSPRRHNRNALSEAGERLRVTVNDAAVSARAAAAV
jgi:hypothetical protein